MPRIHPYGEPRVKDSPVSEFFCWFLIISIGFPTQIGWVLTSLGWIEGITLLWLSLGLGLFAGVRMAWDCARWDRKKKIRNLATSAAENQEAERVAQQCL